MVAMALPSRGGSCQGSTSTEVPSLTRDVAQAAAVSMVSWSQ